MSCVRELSITIAEPPPEANLLEYWNFDEAAGTRVGSVQGIQLLELQVGVVPVQSPGKVGDCCSFPTSFVPPNRQLLCNTNTGLAYANEGITLACWVRITGKDASIVTDHDFMFYQLFTGGGGLLGSFGILYNSSTDSLFVRVTDTILTDSVVAVSAPTLSQWYLIQAIYNESANIIKVRVDNGAITNGASAVVLPPCARGSIRLRQRQNIGSNTTFFVDEIGIWLSELTTAQLDTLWNSGNGTTFPAVPM